MKKVNTKKVAVGVGLGLAAAAAAGAGYYFYGSKNAAGNRKKAARFATSLKADVVKKAKKLEKIDARAYHKVVDEAMKAYKSVKSIDQKDLASAAAELKSNWKHIEAEINRVGKKESKAAKGAVKKVVAKVKRSIPRTVAKKPAKKTAKKKA
jgi:hypothetical protein